jgi:hypothetical protein
MVGMVPLVEQCTIRSSAPLYTARVNAADLYHDNRNSHNQRCTAGNEWLAWFCPARIIAQVPQLL